MIKHLIAAAALTSCSLAASAAVAGSPYTADPSTTVRPYASHALGTSHTGEAWANSGYAATANDDAFGAQAVPATAAPVVAATPQGSVVQVAPQYFYHAEGTMGAH